ncbi:hypothetical protein [Variovorax sp. UC122_21]|uniref:hypothetical protein n=1 Tax=Variovorax sp. UC122_21 TaxID=3374554 RepID=UPI003757BA2A
MADDSNATGDASTSLRPRPQFKPFEWIPCEGLDPSLHHRASFLNDARDVVQGAHLLVQLLQWDEERHDAASPDTDPAPVFEACQRSSLQRFVAVSLGLLHARIEEQCETMRK